MRWRGGRRCSTRCCPATVSRPLPGVARLRADLGTALVPGLSHEDVLDRVRLWTADLRFQLGAQLIEGGDPLRIGGDLSDVADAGVDVLAIGSASISPATTAGCRAAGWSSSGWAATAAGR